MGVCQPCGALLFGQAAGTLQRKVDGLLAQVNIAKVAKVAKIAKV